MIPGRRHHGRRPISIFWIWSLLVRVGLVSVSFGLVGLGFVRFGLVWIGLVSVSFGLVAFGLVPFLGQRTSRFAWREGEGEGTSRPVRWPGQRRGYYPWVISMDNIHG